MADHEKVVVPAATDDLELGMARVELNERTSAAVETPEKLSERVRDVLD